MPLIIFALPGSLLVACDEHDALHSLTSARGKSK